MIALRQHPLAHPFAKKRDININLKKRRPASSVCSIPQWHQATSTLSAATNAEGHVVSLTTAGVVTDSAICHWHCTLANATASAAFATGVVSDLHSVDTSDSASESGDSESASCAEFVF